MALILNLQPSQGIKESYENDVTKSVQPRTKKDKDLKMLKMVGKVDPRQYFKHSMETITKGQNGN